MLNERKQQTEKVFNYWIFIFGFKVPEAISDKKEKEYQLNGLIEKIEYLLKIRSKESGTIHEKSLLNCHGLWDFDCKLLPLA